MGVHHDDFSLAAFSGASSSTPGEDSWTSSRGSALQQDTVAAANTGPEARTVQLSTAAQFTATATPPAIPSSESAETQGAAISGQQQHELGGNATLPTACAGSDSTEFRACEK